MDTKTAKLFIIFGPSGVGKTTLVQELLKLEKYKHTIKVMCSYTTRLPRPGEKDGVDYHFISEQEFIRRAEEGFFLETSTAYKAYYGVSYQDVIDSLARGFSVILVIDRAGVLQVLSRVPEAITIMVVPPHEDILHQRLSSRGITSQQDFEFRLQKAHAELLEERACPLADYSIVNDDLQRAVIEISDIIDAESKA